MDKLKVPKTAKEKREWIIEALQSLPDWSIEKIFSAIQGRLEESLYWVEKMKKARDEQGFGNN